MADPDGPDAGAELAARKRMVLVTAVGAVLAGVLLFALVTRAVSTGNTTGDAGAGDGRRFAQFDVGDAKARASSVARDGPFLFADPRGGSRDIIVQHLGGDDWVAFEARAGGAPRQCILRWEPEPGQFVDPCDGRIYPRDGSGLVSFPAGVNDKGRVVIDLSRPSSDPPP